MPLSRTMALVMSACGVTCELPQCERGCTCTSPEPTNTSGQQFTSKDSNNEISDSKTARLTVPILAAGRTWKHSGRITSQLQPSMMPARQARANTTTADPAVKCADQDQKIPPEVENHDEDGEDTTQSISYDSENEEWYLTAEESPQVEEECWKRGKLNNIIKRGIRIDRHSEKGVNGYGGKLVELGFPEWLASTFGPCVIDIDLPHLPTILVTPKEDDPEYHYPHRLTPSKRVKIMANVNNLFRFRAFNTAPLNQERPFCLVIGSQINDDGWERELNAMMESNDMHFTHTLDRLKLVKPRTKKEYDDFNSSQSQIYILDALDNEGVTTFIEHVNISTKGLHPSSRYKDLHFAITLLGFGSNNILQTGLLSTRHQTTILGSQKKHQA